MKYFQISGNFEFPDDVDVDKLSDEILKACDTLGGVMGGGITEVDEEGNSIKQSWQQ